MLRLWSLSKVVTWPSHWTTSSLNNLNNSGPNCRLLVFAALYSNNFGQFLVLILLFLQHSRQSSTLDVEVEGQMLKIRITTTMKEQLLKLKLFLFSRRSTRQVEFYLWDARFNSKRKGVRGWERKNQVSILFSSFASFVCCTGCLVGGGGKFIT